MLISDVCTPDVVHCGAKATALDVAQLMRHHHVGDVVVVDSDEDDRSPIGVVTDRDLAVKVMAEGLNPAMVGVTKLMRTPVVIAQSSEDCAQLLERMERHGVRRVPVVDGANVLVGVVSLDDLLKMIVIQANALVAVIDKGTKAERHGLR